MGPPAYLPGMWRHPLLRRLAQPTCHETRARDRPSGHRVGGAGRALAVLLSGRRVRGILMVPPRVGVARGLPAARSTSPNRGLGETAQEPAAREAITCVLYQLRIQKRLSLAKRNAMLRDVKGVLWTVPIRHLR